MAYNTFNPIVYKGLVLYLDAENLKSYSGSGLNWYDLTSNGNSGVLTNGATFSLSGNSIQFDGVDDYVDCGTKSDFVFGTGPFAISIWFKMTDISSGYSILFSSGPGSNSYQGVLTANYTGNTLDYFANGFRISDTTPFLSNTWYNAVLVGNGDFDGFRNIKLYSNGYQVGITYTYDYDFSDGRFIIGGNNSSLSEVMMGNISVVKIYNRALTPSEVLQNYNATKWRFMNESEVLPSIVTDQLVLNLDAGDTSSYPGSGTTWYDLTVNNNDGALTNGVVYNSGSMSFDGIDDYINFSTTNLSSTGDITIDTFIRLNGTQESYANIIDYSHSGPPGLGGFVVQQNAPVGVNSFYFAWWTGSGFDFCYFQVPLTNTYFHLVITKSGGSAIVYIDGVSSFTGSGSSYLDGVGRTMRIGNNVAGYSRHIKGSIGEFRIYDKALTSTEVLQNFNAQKNRYGL